MAVPRGRSERRGESYSLPYVEHLSDARTKLADFFSILLDPTTRSSPEGPPPIRAVRLPRFFQHDVRVCRSGLERNVCSRFLLRSPTGRMLSCEEPS